MYLGPLCYGYALNCHLVHLEIPGTRLLCMKKQNLFVLLIYEGCPSKSWTFVIKRDCLSGIL